MNPIHTGVDDPSSNPKPLSQRAKDAGSSAAEKVKGAAHHGAQNAKARLSEQVESSASTQKARVADRIESVAGVVERVARELEEEEPWLGRSMASAAERARRASTQLRERQLDELTAEVRGWSSHPPLFLGSAFVVGLAIGRFIKGSQQRSERMALDERSEPYAKAKPQPPLPGIRRDFARGADTAPGVGTSFGSELGEEPEPEAVRYGSAERATEEERR